MVRSFQSVITLLLLSTASGMSAQEKRIPLEPTTHPGSAPASRKINIDEAVAFGLANSRSLRLASEAVSRARGRIAENRAGYLPTVSSDLTYTHLDTGSTVTFPDANGNPQTIPIVKQNQKTVGVTANLPIDILGQIRAAVQSSQFQEIAARLDFNRTRNQTVLDIKNAYYDVLRAKAFVDVAEQALKNAQERQSTAESYLRAGTGTRFDVLRAQTEVANAKQNSISARNRVSLAVAALNNILGLDQNTPLDVSEAQEAAAPSKDFNGDVAEAYTKRPEIMESEAQIKAAEKGVILARRSQTPTFGLTWNFNYTPDAGGFAPKETSWAALARVSLPLFEGGLARARTQQARADVNAAKVNKQVAQDNVALEVRQAYLAMVEAQDRLEVTTAALVEAQEQYRLAQVRFKAGVTQIPGASPLLEISDAQTALTQAQSNRVNAQYDLENAKARLDRAVGRYAFDGAAGPGLPTPRPIK